MSVAQIGLTRYDQNLPSLLVFENILSNEPFEKDIQRIQRKR